MKPVNEIQTDAGTVIPVRTGKRFVRSLEYEVMANMTMQQYTRDGEIDFASLLSIPLTERIPALMREYGLKRMQRLIKMVLQEFCFHVPLTKSKKLTETRVAVVSCDLILAAEEDQLGLEDLIVFFEMALKKKFGKFRSVLTHYEIMEKLEQYRQQRFEALVQLKQQKAESYKAMGPVNRTSPEPKPIKDLFSDIGGNITPLENAS
jgi:hypothetical protein